jgi:hypothetical protein
MLILPAVVGLLPSGIGDATTKILSSEAGGALISAAHQAGTLSPYTGRARLGSKTDGNRSERAEGCSSSTAQR